MFVFLDHCFVLGHKKIPLTSVKAFLLYPHDAGIPKGIALWQGRGQRPGVLPYCITAKMCYNKFVF